jgi:hypothetical protein
MAKGKPLLIVVVTVLALSASACTRRSTVDIKAIRAWADSEGYQWIQGPDEIQTEQDFFNYINGAAQPIIDLGWKRSVFGILQKGETRLRLSVYEMRDPKAAVRLLEDNRLRDSQSTLVGDLAFYWDRGLFSKGLLFQKKGSVCEIILEKEEDKGVLLSLAGGMEELIP